MNKKQFFTIGEMARQTGVNFNSLRYYEKLGILPPAWTDPENGYRYYSFTQLHIVEAIVLCRHLNIPLSRFRDFINPEKGTLHYDRLVEEGIARAEEQIQTLQQKIRFLRLMETDYHRAEYILKKNHAVSCFFPPLTLWLTPYDGDEKGPSYSRILKKSMKEIEKAGLKVGLVYGLVYLSKTNRTSFFMEIDDSSGSAESHSQVLSLPSSWYRCMVQKQSAIKEAPRLFSDLFDKSYDKIIFESELFTGDFRYHEPLYEVDCILPPSYAPSDGDDVFPFIPFASYSEK